jgi:ATP adenylyltransferase
LTHYLHNKALWRQVEIVTDSALASGALKSIPTHCETRDVSFNKNEKNSNDLDLIQFQIRVVDNLVRKSKEVQQRSEQTAAPNDFDPFLPYDPALYVGELTDHYRCLLNKFNVMNHHILMVTKKFVPQQAPLDTEDFLAAQICLQAQDGLVFYNGGPLAGASVTHKHLQMIPISPSTSFPFDRIFSQTPLGESISTEASLSFRHRIMPVKCPTSTPYSGLKTFAENNCRGYYHLLKNLNLSKDHNGFIPPHNMLMTRDYLWVVPRTRESYLGFAINALGFAGMLLVKSEAQLKLLDDIGCHELLKAVTL